MTTSLKDVQSATTKPITQGEYAVSGDPDLVITTLLGSCVSCCLWDDAAGIGGMNHLLLAGRVGASLNGYDMAGVADMELVINGILKLGARRENLKAKVFGGAQMLGGRSNIGASNAAFVLDFLEQESIECINHSVGGTAARSLKFWPSSGRVQMRLVNDVVVEDVAPPAPDQEGNDLELF